MKPHPFSLALALALALALVPALAGADDLADRYFTGPNPVLTNHEKAALGLAKEWNGKRPGSGPIRGADGSIQFVYGASRPSVVCAVLQVCDIELEPGEAVNSLHLGDTARWTAEPALTGEGPDAVQHVVVKPLDVGLETSLILTTNRRSYHLRLRSHRTEFMPRVSFAYPERSDAKWAALRPPPGTDRAARNAPETGEYLGNLSFDYTLSGDSPAWKPARVYNDGVKTVIEMPRAMAQTEAPTLLVIRKDGGWFSDPETVLVNYRLQGNRYIVDTLFDKAMLIAGAGSSQDKVIISRGE
jgi:P-type conjugative transfer protein TrbG